MFILRRAHAYPHITLVVSYFQPHFFTEPHERMHTVAEVMKALDEAAAIAARKAVALFMSPAPATAFKRFTWRRQLTFALSCSSS